MFAKIILIPQEILRVGVGEVSMIGLHFEVP